MVDQGQLTHRNTEQADSNLDACNDHERVVDTELQDPIVCTERESEAEEVLEDQETCKCFDGDFTCANISNGAAMNENKGRSIR